MKSWKPAGAVRPKRSLGQLAKSGWYTLDDIWRRGYSMNMEWEIEFTDEFGDWWDGLIEAEQESVRASVKLLGDYGPTLPFPHSSGVHGSRHNHMRELRIQHAGCPFRVLYAFDPRRYAILLIGGDKTGNDRWYEDYVPIADRLYDEHVETLKKEDSENGS